MKTCIALALLVVGINSLPSQVQNGASFNNERIVTDAIASAIEDISQNIKDIGLDPLYIQHDAGSYALPVPIIFNAVGVIDEFLFHGLSEIVINSLSYGLLTNRLRLDISLPLIETTMNKAEVNVVVFGEQFSASSSGRRNEVPRGIRLMWMFPARLAIKDVNVNADIRVSLGIISGISIRSIDLLFKLGGIDSQLTVSVAGYDLSNSLNTFMGSTIPDTLNKFESEINELLEIVALDVINANL